MPGPPPLPMPVPVPCARPSLADRRFQGLQGIVVRDTANTLQLVTPDSRFVVVPKQVRHLRCLALVQAARLCVVRLLAAALKIDLQSKQ